jgi:hypothetical protein
VFADRLPVSAEPRKGGGRERAAGAYRFHLASDDGSRLWLGERLLIDLDGRHHLQSRRETVEFVPGLHPVVLEYLQGPGGMALDLQVGPSQDELGPVPLVCE